jgi:CheY-like chemotaxis protein
MRMRALVVEDDQDFIDELFVVLNSLEGPPDVTVAQSRNSAYEQLESNFFDLVILDLKIPTSDGVLDANPDHGRAVFGRALQLAPGTPIFVLTGSPAEDFIPEMLDRKRQVDIWGEGREVGTVTFLKKSKFAESAEKLAPFAAAVSRLSDVEFERGNTELGTEDDRLVRIFTKRVGGVRCVGSKISGGLSSAKIIRLKVTDNSGASVHDAVVKLGSIPEVRDESNRFDSHISRLDHTATPRKLQTLEFGAKSRAAIFYGLAEGFESDAFEMATKSGTFQAQVVANAKQATKRWRIGVGETRRSIREIRQKLISDVDFQHATAPCSLLWLNDFENRQIQTRWCCVHADLHGSNILARGNAECVLIDYGDVSDGPASLDPITLELSLLFHPRGPLRTSDWPSSDQAAHWADLDVYVAGCPAANFIRACREWATEVAAGQREIAAVAYGYLVRQLKYADTNKVLALALIQGVHEWFMST